MVSEYTNRFGSTGTPVSRFSYTYDEWGNITKISQLTTGKTRKYEYNQYGEITKAVEAYSNGTTSTYSYTTIYYG